MSVKNTTKYCTEENLKTSILIKANKLKIHEIRVQIKKVENEQNIFKNRRNCNRKSKKKKTVL